MEGVNMTDLLENYRRVLDGVKQAALEAGRDPAQVRLLAVSKTFPAEDIRTVFEAGQLRFGENKVQELQAKVPVLPAEIEWHLIGHLQSNKAAKAAETAQWIHSVDSVHLAQKIGNAAARLGKKINILLEVNISGEESKFGLHSFEDTAPAAEAVLQFPELHLCGLMTMAEPGVPEVRLRSTFAGLRALRDRLETEFRIPLPELSMGMTSDYREAILEGSTIVRIGSAIFGGRDYSKK
ncbi:MAG: YggS family pyridoxal phosphate-dependent enzyme [Lentisphaerae bacterium]|nr:YggS family pyridoxal phosphate-dependent enzyme [Lentisphaerota bacterium]